MISDARTVASMAFCTASTSPLSNESFNPFTSTKTVTTSLKAPNSPGVPVIQVEVRARRLGREGSQRSRDASYRLTEGLALRSRLINSFFIV